MVDSSSTHQLLLNSKFAPKAENEQNIALPLKYLLLRGGRLPEKSVGLTSPVGFVPLSSEGNRARCTALPVQSPPDLSLVTDTGGAPATLWLLHWVIVKVGGRSVLNVKN